MGGFEKHIFLGGGNSNIFGIFTPKIAEDESNLTSIFFRWVQTTNQFFLPWKNFNPFNHGELLAVPPVPRNATEERWSKNSPATGDFSSAVPLYLHELDHAVYTPESGVPRSGTSPVKLISTRCLWLKCGSSNRRWVNDDT